jgi:hypothetical protein
MAIRAARAAAPRLKSLLPQLFKARPKPNVPAALLLAAAAAAFLVLGGTAAQFPIMVSDQAAAWLLGEGAPGHQPARICVQPPNPTAGPAAVDEDGKATPEALAVLGQVPRGTDARHATAWTLWRLAHPDDNTDFDAFAGRYDKTAAQLTPLASPTEVVETMDDHADYRPYLLVALAGTYRMARGGAVRADGRQRSQLVEDITTTCGRRP